jgi:hypothetical protein
MGYHSSNLEAFDQAQCAKHHHNSTQCNENTYRWFHLLIPSDCVRWVRSGEQAATRPQWIISVDRVAKSNADMIDGPFRKRSVV